MNPCINIHYLLKIDKSIANVSTVDLVDAQDYCIIRYLDNSQLQLLFYTSLSLVAPNKILHHHGIPTIFIANDAKSICNLLKYHNRISLNISSNHALYLGRELMKAELALVMNQQYVQD